MGRASLDTAHAVLISSRWPAVSRRQSPRLCGYRVPGAAHTSGAPARHARGHWLGDWGRLKAPRAAFRAEPLRTPFEFSA